MSYCENCGTSLSKGEIFCTQCGKKVEFNDFQQNDDRTESVSQPLCEVIAAPPKKSHKLILSLVVAILAVACIAVATVLIADDGLFINSKVEKIIVQSESYAALNITDIEILTVEPLLMADAGADSDWRYVFGRYKTGGTLMYFTHPVDVKQRVLSDITIMNPYVHQMWSYILLNGTEELNSLMFYEMKYLIESNGFDYFENTDNSVEFLRDITGPDGFVDTNAAREALLAALPNIYKSETIEKWNNMDGFALLFEKDSAVPLLITGKTTTQEYQWNYPEAYLDTMDRETRAAFNHVFGPAYVTKEKWVTGVIDPKTGNTESGKNFTSYEAVKKHYDAEEIGE